MVRQLLRLPQSSSQAHTEALPEREALHAVLRDADSAQAAAQDLLAPSPRWWRCCSEAVRAEPSWLHDGRGAEVRAWLESTLPDHTAAGSIAGVDHAWLIGRLLGAPGDAGMEHDDVLTRLAKAWKENGLTSEAASGSAQPSGRGLADVSPRVAACLRNIVDSVGELQGHAEPSAPWNMVVITALLMAGATCRRRLLVPVVFGRTAGTAPTAQDVSLDGATGVLELMEFPAGPAGLYPDPRAMAAVCSPNGQFAESLGFAWNAAGRRREGRCVLWRLVLPDEPRSAPPALIEGPSLGAAFALGLRDLVRHRASAWSPTAWLRDSVYGLRPRTAVTGALDAGGDRLLRVTGMEAKLLAARQKRFRLVAPEENRLDVAAAPEPGDVRFAANLRRADRYARRIRTGRQGAALVTVVALVAATIAVRTAENASDQARSARATRAVALSRHLAAESLTADKTDPRRARTLAVEAWHASPTEEARSAIQTLLTRQEQGGILLGHQRDVSGVAFNGSGTMLASTDGLSVLMWNPISKKQIGPRMESKTTDPMESIALSPSGHIVAAAGAGGSVWSFNTKTGQRLGYSHMHDGYGTPDGSGIVAFNPNGTVLATTYGDTLQLRNPSDLREIGLPVRATGPLGTLTAMAFNPSGTILATADEQGTVLLWNVADGPSSAVVAAAYRSGDTGQKTPEIHGELGHSIKATTDGKSGVSHLAFNPQGTILATGSGSGEVRLWNPASQQPVGDPIVVLDGISVAALAFSSNGKKLLTLGVGEVEFWDTTDGHSVGHFSLPDESGASGMALNSTGTVLAIACRDKTVRVYNPDTQRPIGSPETVVSYASQPVALSPDGAILAVVEGENTVWLLDAHTQQPIAPPFNPAAHGTYVDALAIDPTGTVLATADRDGAVRLWNLKTWRKIGTPLTIPHTHGPQDYQGAGQMTFNPSGTVLATADDDGTVRLWNLEDRREIGRPIIANQYDSSEYSSAVDALAFNPSGTILATADDDGTIRLWSATTQRQFGAAIHAPGDSGGEEFNDLAFDPRGTVLVTAGTDGMVHKWNPATQREVGKPFAADGEKLSPALSGLHQPVEKLAFSPDGTVLATHVLPQVTTRESSVRLWNAASGKEIGFPISLPDDGPLTTLTFSPHGRTLIAVSDPGHETLWPTDEWTDPYRALCAQTGPFQGFDLISTKSMLSGTPVPTLCG